MTALNDRRLITISADSRALIRASIRKHPDWLAYREANDIDLSEMTTREAIFDCCDALEINIAAVIAAGPQDEDQRPPRAPRQAKVAARLFDEDDDARPHSAPLAHVTTPPAIQIAPAPQEAANQLLSLISSLAPKATLDVEQVRDIVANAIGISQARTDDRIADVDRNLSRAILNMVADLDAKIANGPAVRIELKRGEEIKTLAGHHHPQFPRLLRVLTSRQSDARAPSVWISGPAGSGKTHAAKSAAKALGVAFHYNGALSMPHELLGFIDAGGTYHRTPFREAYEHGGLYLFDEVDGSDNSALLALNAALANGAATFPDGQIARHADCYIVATANTWGLGATADYVGRSKIDAAFLSRFPVRMAWDYDEPLEQQISGDKAFAKRVQAARAKARTAGLKVLIDPRATIAGAALIAQGFTSDEAAELTYLANLTADQRRMIGA